MAERADKVVSSESEELILVDAHDNPTGTLSKALCHNGDGILHRAFSLFIFNDKGELLLQQRSGEKRLWPLYWSNSCCSHPRSGETMAQAVDRRLAQELGMRSELEFIYKFRYQANYAEEGSEHELCSVYLGRSNARPSVNANEIAEVRYLSAKALEDELGRSAQRFTPWFKLEWTRLKKEFGEQLASYTSS